MVKSLNEYARKRHFDSTREPRGDEAAPASAELRFVVQHHVARADHYDFRLEWDGVLKSWAVPKGPSYDSHDKRLAVQVEDHPLEYRNFEGTIPKGQYGGGVVMIWDQGDWQPLGDAAAGLAEGALKFTLNGSRLKGKWALVRMKPKPGEKNVNWLLIKEKDEYEGIFDVAKFTASVATGRTMTEIEADATKENTVEETRTAKDPKPARATPSSGKKATPEEHAAAEYPLSHPEKVLYKGSGITKGDIARYYLDVSQRMLPYLEKRIISAVRCPGGIERSCFYKKHPGSDTLGRVTVPVPGGKGANDDYYYIGDINGLMSEVQMNTLEFHVWCSRVDDLEHPDMMVFDLDPDEGMDLERIRQGVNDLKGILDQLSLVSYLKTSGGKGYHVVIPFRPAAGWEAFEGFAKNTAKTMEAMWPDRYTSNVRKNKRNNRIFIDWIRNGRGATSIAPYSVRAREGAPVSMPLSWQELGTVAPNGVTMRDALRRIGEDDPWAGFFETDQRLK